MARNSCSTNRGSPSPSRSGLFYFNHAHDEYLQLAVEGGAMLAVPAAIVLTAGAWRIMQRLRADHAPMFWIRVVQRAD